MKVDQFESVFRAAARDPYRFDRIALKKILVISDLEGPESEEYTRDIQKLLSPSADDSEWVSITASGYTNVDSLLQLTRDHEADLIVTYRNLKSDAWNSPYSLGEHLDVLTLYATPPVLVTPHPKGKTATSHQMNGADRVMAMTDHLAGDHRLVNFALQLTQPNGKLLLAHVEDDSVFSRYMDVISKIDSIETEPAHDAIKRRLLKEPADYIKSCEDLISQESLPLSIDSFIGMGHQLSEYKRLVEEHSVDLLVMKAKDGDQLAMHGISYPLSVELREIPLLLL